MLDTVEEGARAAGMVWDTSTVPPARRPSAQALTRRLAAAGCVAAEEEAEELLAAAPDGAVLESWLRRREQGEPLAWITGASPFCERVVAVDPGVYVPRIQSEDLARRAAALLGRTGGRAVDLCTGSGAVATHLMDTVPTAGVVGVDIDARAVACARRNRVPAVVDDLGQSLRNGVFDVVTAIPLYVPTGDLRLLPADVQRYEPRQALDGGSDGLDVVRRVVAAATRLLRDGGWLLLEVGGDQDVLLAATLDRCGFDETDRWFDEDGDLRGLAVRRSAGSGGTAT
jgi:release factor glutamine methyltransferase